MQNVYLGSFFIPEKYVIRVLFVSPWMSLIPPLAIRVAPPGETQQLVQHNLKSTSYHSERIRWDKLYILGRFWLCISISIPRFDRKYKLVLKILMHISCICYRSRTFFSIHRLPKLTDIGVSTGAYTFCTNLHFFFANLLYCAICYSSV